MNKILINLTILVTLLSCSLIDSTPSSPIMSLDISANGRYVISAHKNQHLYLWDIEKSTTKQISDSANIYSASFEYDSTNIVWQDSDNTVYVQGIDGKTLKQFNLFPTYGHATNGDKYLAINSEYKVIIKNQNETLTLKEEGGSFLGFGKLFNIAISDDWRYLVTAGFGSPYDAKMDSIKEQAKVQYKDLSSVTLWDFNKLEPIAKLTGISSKTYATISPDGKYIVGVDEGSRNYVWKTSDPTKPMTENGDPGLGVRKNGKWDTTNVLPLPDNYIDPGHHYGILVAKFLDDTHYITIYTYEPFAFLYEIGNPNPIKWFSLGMDPFPAVSDYSRNTAIDTAPAAGILVTGQRDSGGINVYQYNKEKQTLEKIWVAN